MAINDRREMRPAILATGNVRDIHGPPLVAPTGSTDPALDSRPWGRESLMDHPPLLLQHPIHRLLVHGPCRLPAQERPEMSIPERGMLLNQPSELLNPWGGRSVAALSRCLSTMQARSGHL
jgi:hypothetical protein